ncbi:UNVERIFIED_CONTAM: hypothetical protein Sindi_2652700 [Sesamum indicum]
MDDISPSIQDDISPSIMHDISPSVMHDISPSIMHDISPSIKHDISPSRAYVIRPFIHLTYLVIHFRRHVSSGPTPVAEKVTGRSPTRRKNAQGDPAATETFAATFRPPDAHRSSRNASVSARLRRRTAKQPPPSGVCTFAAVSPPFPTAVCPAMQGRRQRLALRSFPVG